MSDEEQAKHEIDEVLLNVEQALRRVSRAIETVEALGWAEPELAALRKSRDQLLATRRALAEGALRTPQQRLL